MYPSKSRCLATQSRRIGEAARIGGQEVECPLPFVDHLLPNRVVQLFLHVFGQPFQIAALQLQGGGGPPPSSSRGLPKPVS